METDMAMTERLVTPRSIASCWLAGATIDDEREEM
jgi:hypothetical protein